MRSILLLMACILLPLPLVTGQRAAPQGPGSSAERAASWQAHRAMADTSPFRGLEWRSVGPVVQGGRVVDIAFVPGKRHSFYAAYASGGLWRTDNNGQTFKALFQNEATIILGDIATDPNAPERVWVGTGENNSSRSSYGGHGVYLSEDGGETFAHKGLVDTDRIGRIVIDPRDKNRVYIAAIGSQYSKRGQRGLFRTEDSGKTWKLVLKGEGMTGAIDMALHPGNPDIVYVATWERSRRPWDFVEGGDGSAIWKSSDRGATWTRLSGGFPAGKHVGRIGLAVCRDAPDVLYACVDNQELLPEDEWDLGGSSLTVKRVRGMTEEEFLSNASADIESFLRGNDFHPDMVAEELIEKMKEGEITVAKLLDELADGNAALFETDIRGLEVWRSDDAGGTWKRTHEKPLLGVVNTYGYYFGQIRVAPDNPDRVITVGVPIIASDDGGKSWHNILGRGVHVDHHALWIDPENSRHMILGNDGGLDATYDDGKSWTSIDSQAVGQFYTLALDNAEPFNIYGGLQDNGTLKGSSESDPDRGPSWDRVGGGDGMYVQVDPRDDKTVYYGFQFGHYSRRGPAGRGGVRPRDRIGESALRYNWATPILLSSHNADVIYFGANSLNRSMDRGETWTPISEDLSRSPQRGDVPFATITAVAESHEEFGRIWCGTDDGQVWMTPDGGRNWRDIAAGLPTDRWVSRIELSRVEEGRAYLTMNGYRDDDIAPYVFVTEDAGKSWTSIADGLPTEAVNVIREDPLDPEILYVGTDRGVYVSLDRGKSWLSLSHSLPSVPVHDLRMHKRDRMLVAATHGRSVWVLDGLPVQELRDLKEEAVHVFPIEDRKFSRGWRRRPSRWPRMNARDPELEFPVYTRDGGDAVLEVKDDDGEVHRRLEIKLDPGINTITWDLLVDSAVILEIEKAKLLKPKKSKPDEDEPEEDEPEEDEPPSTEGTRGKMPVQEGIRLGWLPYCQPGDYDLVLTVGEASHSRSWTMKKPSSRSKGKKKKDKVRGR